MVIDTRETPVIAPDQNYRAFISYSHADTASAKRLHRRLESYRIPGKLVNQAGERGIIPARLTPIFRDLDELPAADDLSTEIKTALAKSSALIVLASPAAKASYWVNKEIETFRELHGAARPVLVALINGEPCEAFPAALMIDGHEPVAADFRGGGASGKLALLKLVAGLSGAGLDQLVQRDAQRQMRRVTTITIAALIAMLILGLLLIMALQARTEAEHQRQQAEGLVEYMLTDLRDKLQGVGRLDVMTAVNARAMAYYTSQGGLAKLSAESLDRRARILHAMGEDDQKRGNPKLALGKFEEASRTTAAVLAKKPNDPDAIFAHAQSEFWLGSIAYERKDRVSAQRNWLEYSALANRLVKIDSANINWQREAGYAQGNLCALALQSPINKENANKFCASALSKMQYIQNRIPGDLQTKKDLINGYGWMADTYLANGELNKCVQSRMDQEKIIIPILKLYPQDTSLLELQLKIKISFSEIFIIKNDFKNAKIEYYKALFIYKNLISTDKTNNSWSNWNKILSKLNKTLKG